MVRSGLALGGTALLLAALDLAHKAGTDASYFHARSLSYVVVVVGLAVCWTAAILLTRSLPLALGGGAVLGGAGGNLLSLAFWPGVPDPILLGPVAFNLADLFVLFGFLLVARTTLAFALRSSELLREPVRLR